MSILSKLNYIKVTKEMLRNSLNKFGANLTEASTFRSYATFINTLYDNYPKGSSEGTKLILTGTKEGKLDLTLKGNITQNSGSISLASPKSLHLVTGLNTIVVCGKNIFDKEHANIVDGNIANDMITSSTTRKVLYIPCEPSTTYTISKFATTGINAVFTVASAISIDPEDIYSTDLYSVTSDSTASSITYTSDSEANYLVVLFYNSNNTQYTYDETLGSVQIEYGSSATQYAPYVGQKYPLNLYSIELRGIGDIHDYILKENDRWYYKQCIVQQNPSSSYNFIKNDTQPISGETLFYYDNYYANNDGNSTSNIVYAMSSMFKGLGYKDMMSDDTSTEYAVSLQCDTSDNRRVWLRVPSSIASDVDTLKSLMTTYAPKLYIATKSTFYQNIPITNATTVAQLNAIEKAKAVNGITNVYQINNDGSFIIKAKYLEGDE